VLPVLDSQDFGQLGAQRWMLALIGADLALEHDHRSLLGTGRFVIPPLDGRETQEGPLSGHGMAPPFERQLLELVLQLASGRRRRQKSSDDAEAEMSPAFMGAGALKFFFHAMSIFSSSTAGAALRGNFYRPHPDEVARHPLRKKSCPQKMRCKGTEPVVMGE